MRILSLIAVVLFVSSLAAPAWAGMMKDLEDCEQNRDLDRVISGCTALIRSGQLPDEYLAVAYGNRGFGYLNLGEHAQAIEDFDQALRLDPGKAEAYNNRAIAHCELGQVKASLDDRMQALRLESVRKVHEG